MLFGCHAPLHVVQPATRRRSLNLPRNQKCLSEGENTIFYARLKLNTMCVIMFNLYRL